MGATTVQENVLTGPTDEMTGNYYDDISALEKQSHGADTAPASTGMSKLWSWFGYSRANPNESSDTPEDTEHESARPETMELAHEPPGGWDASFDDIPSDDEGDSQSVTEPPKTSTGGSLRRWLPSFGADVASMRAEITALKRDQQKQDERISELEKAAAGSPYWNMIKRASVQILASMCDLKVSFPDTNIASSNNDPGNLGSIAKELALWSVKSTYNRVWDGVSGAYDTVASYASGAYSTAASYLFDDDDDETDESEKNATKQDQRQGGQTTGTRPTGVSTADGSIGRSQRGPVSPSL